MHLYDNEKCSVPIKKIILTTYSHECLRDEPLFWVNVLLTFKFGAMHKIRNHEIRALMAPKENHFKPGVTKTGSIFQYNFKIFEEFFL